MRAAVHVDLAIGVRAADVEDEDALDLRQLDELDAVRRQELAHEPRRLAARVWLELVPVAIGEQCLSPRLERHRFGRLDRLSAAATWQEHAFVARRRAAEQHAAFGVARRRSGRRTGITSAAASLLCVRRAAGTTSLGHADLHAAI